MKKFLIPSVPGGKYYVDFDYESGGFSYIGYTDNSLGTQNDPARQAFNLIVWRDVPTYANYFWCLLFVSIMPQCTGS